VYLVLRKHAAAGSVWAAVGTPDWRSERREAVFGRLVIVVVEEEEVVWDGVGWEVVGLAIAVVVVVGLVIAAGAVKVMGQDPVQSVAPSQLRRNWERQHSLR
jgi:hypothetical protein